MVMLVISLILIVLSIVLFCQEPRRALNSFVLEGGLAAFVLYLQTAIPYSQQLWDTFYWLYVIAAVLCLLLGAALLFDGVVLLRREGRSLTNLLPFGFGLLTLGAGVMMFINMNTLLAGSYWEVVLQSLVRNLVLYTPLALGGFVLFALFYPLYPKDKTVDNIIVLGCMIRKDGTPTPLLQGRLNRALAFWKKGGCHARFIVSGGQGANEVISEAESMKQYLLSKGVPEDKIVLEAKSRNTRENLLFSQKLTAPGERSILCTSSYHVPRAVMLARSLHLPMQGIGGRTALYYLPAAFFREYVAVIFRNKLVVLLYVVFAAVLALL